MKKLLTLFILLLVLYTKAQVKIGNNPATINSNSLLELESTDKGFLPPRVALNSISSVSPLTATVPAGMLVFSSGGTLTDGYYYWSGTEWKRLGNGDKNMVSKTATATLTKTENFVLASNDITLTLPAVTTADNGMEMTIKNMGIHTDLVTVVGSGGATIDGLTNSKLTRYMGETFVVSGTNWLVKDAAKNIEDHVMDVDEGSSWTTIQEAIDFLNLHMTSAMVIRLADDNYDITETIVIDLPFAVTIQGLSYGTANINAASGLAGKPMFRCLSESYFKMLNFDATALAGYGTAAGEDAIRFLGSGTYNEIKDCTFDRFYNTILDSTDAELWIFESDISNAQNNGILIHGNVAGVIVKVAESDFIGCVRGINLDKGSAATIQLASGGYYNSNSTDTAIVYKASDFTAYSSISIKGNLWNNTGKFIEGFDFSRSDGRDANVITENNAGIGDSKPQCFINVLNSSTNTTLTNQNTWYKVNWGTNTTTETTKWTVNNNRITYQSSNRRNGWIIISGNVSASSSSQNITVGIVKNGVSGTQYGATTIRTVTSDQPFPFSLIVYLADIAPTDYFELYSRNETSSGRTVKFQDIQWLVNTQ
jgi:hypothetical protein